MNSISSSDVEYTNKNEYAREEHAVEIDSEDNEAFIDEEDDDSQFVDESEGYTQDDSELHNSVHTHSSYDDDSCPREYDLDDQASRLMDDSAEDSDYHVLQNASSTRSESSNSHNFDDQLDHENAADANHTDEERMFGLLERYQRRKDIKQKIVERRIVRSKAQLASVDNMAFNTASLGKNVDSKNLDTSDKNLNSSASNDFHSSASKNINSSQSKNINSSQSENSSDSYSPETSITNHSSSNSEIPPSKANQMWERLRVAFSESKASTLLELRHEVEMLKDLLEGCREENEDLLQDGQMLFDENEHLLKRLAEVEQIANELRVSNRRLTEKLEDMEYEFEALLLHGETVSAAAAPHSTSSSGEPLNTSNHGAGGKLNTSSHGKQRMSLAVANFGHRLSHHEADSSDSKLGTTASAAAGDLSKRRSSSTLTWTKEDYQVAYETIQRDLVKKNKLLDQERFRNLELFKQQQSEIELLQDVTHLAVQQKKDETLKVKRLEKIVKVCQTCKATYTIQQQALLLEEQERKNALLLKQMQETAVATSQAATRARQQQQLLSSSSASAALRQQQRKSTTVQMFGESTRGSAAGATALLFASNINKTDCEEPSSAAAADPLATAAIRMRAKRMSVMDLPKNLNSETCKDESESGDCKKAMRKASGGRRGPRNGMTLDLLKELQNLADDDNDEDDVEKPQILQDGSDYKALSNEDDEIFDSQKQALLNEDGEIITHIFGHKHDKCENEIESKIENESEKQHSEPKEQQFEPMEHLSEPKEHQFEPKEHQSEPKEHQFEPKEHQSETKEHQSEPKEQQLEPREHHTEPNEQSDEQQSEPKEQSEPIEHSEPIEQEQSEPKEQSEPREQQFEPNEKQSEPNEQQFEQSRKMIETNNDQETSSLKQSASEAKKNNSTKELIESEATLSHKNNSRRQLYMNKTNSLKSRSLRHKLMEKLSARSLEQMSISSSDGSSSSSSIFSSSSSEKLDKDKSAISNQAAIASSSPPPTNDVNNEVDKDKQTKSQQQLLFVTTHAINDDDDDASAITTASSKRRMNPLEAIMRRVNTDREHRERRISEGGLFGTQKNVIGGGGVRVVRRRRRWSVESAPEKKQEEALEEPSMIINPAEKNNNYKDIEEDDNEEPQFSSQNNVNNDNTNNDNDQPNDNNDHDACSQESEETITTTNTTGRRRGVGRNSLPQLIRGLKRTNQVRRMKMPGKN